MSVRLRPGEDGVEKVSKPASGAKVQILLAGRKERLELSV